MPTYEDDLIIRARELQRLLTRRRKLRRHLKQTETEIKAARKALLAVKAASEGRRPDIAPSRLHANVVGLDTLHSACRQYTRPNGVLGGPCTQCGRSQPEHVTASELPEPEVKPPSDDLI